MKKTFKNILIIAGIGVISGTTIISCQQRTRSSESNTEEQETIQNLENKVQASYEDAKSKLDGVFTEDPEFVTKLDVKLQEFNQSLENLEYEVKSEGEEVNEDVKNNIANLKSEAQELEEKIGSWGEASAEDLEELKNEIAEDFNRLVASLDSAKI
jgi:predicted RNase H-like nuclease (RuvC/YqgF family)